MREKKNIKLDIVNLLDEIQNGKYSNIQLNYYFSKIYWVKSCFKNSNYMQYKKNNRYLLKQRLFNNFNYPLLDYISLHNLPSFSLLLVY
mgnify:CR=1 FL=1